MKRVLRGSSGYPAQLERIPDPPELLYVLGDAAHLTGPAIAIVGSRRATAEGMLFAEQLAADLAERGLVVVSGLAYGIDAAAHRGALATGRTVAVLASGADVPSPAGHRALYDRIRDAGALVSEFPPGLPARAHHFLQRNRIVSGLALGTVVVEAAARSGALMTARYAREQDREVFAVPGPPWRATAVGTNALLKDGAALVRGWRDVVAELRSQLGERFADDEKPTPRRPGRRPAGRAQLPLTIVNVDDLSGSRRPASREARRILQVLGGEPRHVDDLQVRTGLAMPALLAELSELEIHGLVRQFTGKYFGVARG